jgi:hypothetical protein
MQKDQQLAVEPLTFQKEVVRVCRFRILYLQDMRPGFLFVTDLKEK